MNNPLIMWVKNYFYLRQRIPIFIYVFYLHYKNSDNPVINGVIKTVVSLIGLGIVCAVTGFIFDVPFRNLIPLKWGYPGLITWGIFFLIYYWITNKKVQNNLTAFTFSTLATVGGGWLYEIAFFHPLEMFFSKNAILIINSQIMCLILLAYELKKMKFKPDNIILESFITFTAFSVWLFLDFDQLVYKFTIAFDSRIFLWLYRLPACLFLLSLIRGIKK